MANPLTLAQYIEQKTAFDPKTTTTLTPEIAAKQALEARQNEWKGYEASHKALLEQSVQSHDVSSTLQARGNRYGSFVDNACVSQDFKTTLRKGPSWNTMAPDQKEALEMIVHKIARILNGDPNYSDSWHDIAGYATLVCDRLKKYE